jgi:hypothetical protein
MQAATKTNGMPKVPVLAIADFTLGLDNATAPSSLFY